MEPSTEALLLFGEKVALTGSYEWYLQGSEVLWTDGMFALFDLPLTPNNRISLTAMRQRILEEDQQIVRERLDSVLHTGGLMEYDFRIVDARGQIKTIYTWAQIICDADQQALCLRGTCQDVTRLRAYEKELEYKNLKLKQKNKEVSDFALNASHVLYEPVRKIRTYLDLARRSGHHSEQLDRYFTKILSATDDLTLFIDNLFAMSRFNKDTFTYTQVDFQAVVTMVLFELRNKIKQHGAKVEASDLPVLTANAEQVKFLFKELIENALKYSRPDAVPHIRISSEPVGFSPDSFFRISVADNGIGIEQSYADQVFNLLYKIYSRNDYKGEGMGLAICKLIMDNHQGVIFLRSTPGEGTMVITEFPVHHPTSFVLTGKRSESRTAT